MTKIGLKILLIALISSFVLVLNSDISKSCSGDITADDYYSVFDPKIINQPSLTPFFLSTLLFFPEQDSTIFNEKQQNLIEWKRYFSYIPDIKDIEEIIYSTKQKDLEEILEFFSNGTNNRVEEKYRNNSLFNYWIKNKNVPVIEYIHYTKECEPFVSEYDYWDIPQRDTVAMLGLIEKGKHLYEITEDSFLKLRYAFQITRLSHYTGNYNKAIEFYDNLVANQNVDSNIKYLALSLKAGALYHLGKVDESNYFFSVVFDKYPPKRFTASLSFHLNNDSSFNASLKLCKNNKESSALWMLAAYKNPELSLEALRQIFALDSKSPYLELLLAREVNRFEAYIFPSTYNYTNSYIEHLIENNNKSTNYGNDLLKIVLEIANSKNVLHPHLWYLVAGYLSTLTGNTHNATPYFYYAEDSWPKESSKEKDKIKLFQEMNDALNCIFENRVNENSLVPHLTWLYEQSQQPSGEDNWVGGSYVRARNNALSAFMFVINKLAQTYACNGQFLKMHLCLGSGNFGYNLEANPKNEPLDNLISFFDKPQKTDFEKLLLSMYKYTKFDLLGIKGTVLINQHRFREAINIFNSIGRSGYLQADPFVIHLNDCRDCDIRNSNKTSYTQLSFAKRILELDSLATLYKKKADKYYFLMANGFYNISYYGNCWNASSYNRDFDYDQMYNEKKDWEFYDCSKAKEYYDKARLLTKDKEFAAKCCFMASKCEQNSFYNNLYKMRFEEDGDYSKEKSKYREYFKLLKEKYSETRFFKEALKECKYFNYFVTNKSVL